MTNTRFSMQILTDAQVAELLSSASGPVSYQSQYARTTAIVTDGRWTRKSFARDYLNEILEAERKAAPKPERPTVTAGPRSSAYAGPFPRGRHSHRCKGCGENAVACYKAKCTKPQLTATCEWCEKKYR